jgi:hypothetical protein
MCMQCLATASVAVGSASGIRVWLHNHGGAWLTPSRLRAITVALVALAVLGAGIGLNGSG